MVAELRKGSIRATHMPLVEAPNLGNKSHRCQRRDCIPKGDRFPGRMVKYSSLTYFLPMPTWETAQRTEELILTKHLLQVITLNTFDLIITTL